MLGAVALALLQRERELRGAQLPVHRLRALVLRAVLLRAALASRLVVLVDATCGLLSWEGYSLKLKIFSQIY